MYEGNILDTLYSENFVGLSLSHLNRNCVSVLVLLLSFLLFSSHNLQSLLNIGLGQILAKSFMITQA